MCTPRNLVLLTCATATLLMVDVDKACWLCSLYLTPVNVVIVVFNETHRSRVICKLDKEVGAGCRFAVVDQQSKKEGSQHTSLVGTVFSVMVRELLLFNPICLWSHNVKQPGCKGSC